MTILCFPPEIHERSIETLGLSVRATNVLRRNNYHLVGDLDGLGVEMLAALHHVGGTTVDEVVQASVRAMTQTSMPEHRPTQQVADVPSSLKEEPAEQGWRIPDEFADSPIATLGLQSKTQLALESRGITTLRHLDGFTIESLQTKLYVAAGPARRIASALESLLSMDPSWLRLASPVAEADAFVLPTCGPEVLEALSEADGISGELMVLLGDLGDRDRHFVLARWCYFNDEQPTLDSLANEAGVTRERVRQIVDRAEQRLQTARLVLPQASLLVAALRDAGGVMSTRQFQERVAQRELCTDVGPIRTLPHLSRLGLIPRIALDSNWQLWVTGPGEELVKSGKLPSVLDRVSRYLRRQLRMRSCIDAGTLPARLPFGADHALMLAVRGSTRVEWAGSYGIPVPLTRSKLTNAALKLLAVSQSVSLEQAYSALERTLGPMVPPPEALERILSLHPQISVEQDRIRADASLNAEKVLSPAEHTAVALFAAGGNVLLAGNFFDGMVRSGFSVAMASVVLRKPYVRRIGAGIYGLRGRSIHRDTVRARVQERSRERNRNVVASERVGDKIVVRYRLTRFSRNGVLAQPKELRDISGIWVSHFPDEHDESPLKMDNGFVWTILPWLKKLKAKEGDFVIGTFDRAAQQVSWKHESANF
jgi:hypothetical protein